MKRESGNPGPAGPQAHPENDTPISNLQSLPFTRSLTLKLILAFLAVSLVGTLLLALITGRTTASEFGTFVISQQEAEIAGQLAAYYESQGSWNGVAEWLSTIEPGPGMMGGMGPPEGAGPPGGAAGSGRGAGRGRNSFALADASGQILVAGMGYSRNEQVAGDVLAEGTPIVVGGQTVGTLLWMRGMSVVTPAGTAFLERVNRLIIWAAAGATIAALLLGVLLARTLTRPLHELTAATHDVAQGDLGRQVEVHSEDELGQLARGFNRMSRDLAYAQQRRRQMTADIAHDLRTPIAIIQGHAEALRDGVLPPDADSFNLIHEEALRLNRLVEDLRTLSRVEAGELSLVRRPVAVVGWLQRLVTAQQTRAREQGVSLELTMSPQLEESEMRVTMDPDRMAQVVNNLVDNAIRHSSAGETVSVGLRGAGGAMQITVRDRGPGIDPQDLSHVFERFYRADKSRQRHRGGSGLGLAIAQSIVEAHDGRIWVESEAGQGATFFVELKAVERLTDEGK